MTGQLPFDLRPSQGIVMVADPYHLIEDRHEHAFRFCWYFRRPDGMKADFRNDGLIYVGGFEKMDDAMAWAIEQGYIEI